MKYLFITYILLVLLVTACKKEPIVEDKNQFQVEFYNGCIQSIKNSAGTNFNSALASEYCNCVIETVLPQLNEQEIKQISEPNNKIIQNKINNLVEPCLQSYLNKSESLEKF